MNIKWATSEVVVVVVVLGSRCIGIWGWFAVRTAWRLLVLGVLGSTIGRGLYMCVYLYEDMQHAVFVPNNAIFLYDTHLRFVALCQRISPE